MIDSQVSHYRLVRKLGAGTFGEVYEGVHVHDEELRVAIKLVSPSLVQDARFVDALKRECRQLDKMRHPNIVTFRDLVVQGDQVAMLLELLRGQDLHNRLASGPLAVDTAVSVLEAMLDGLAYAHAAGVLHRDIKPGNVFWCDDGRIVILDFGIARAADGTQATKTGHMVGTFDYMAPERFDGQHGSASSDVYAMGLIAWELLTGRVACPEGESGRKMKWHLMHGLGGTSAVHAAAPSCPSWLAEVVATLAATEVSERPADGAAALALLREKRAAAGATSAAAGSRRPPPPTVMGPSPVGSTPQVAVTAPPVTAPPSTMGRSAPPQTVMGPLPVLTPSAPPPTTAPSGGPLHLTSASPGSAPSSPASAPSGKASLPLLGGGALVLALMGVVVVVSLREPESPEVTVPVPAPTVPVPAPTAAVPASTAAVPSPSPARGPPPAPTPTATPAPLPPSPSFSCAQATQLDEVAICRSPELAELDNALSRAYSAARSEQQVYAQRAWLAQRASCGNDEGCLRAHYLRRLSALSAAP